MVSGSSPSEHGLNEVRSPAKYSTASEVMEVDSEMDDRDEDASDAPVDCAA